MFFNYIIYFFIIDYRSDYSNVTLVLRLIASMLCLPLMFKRISEGEESKWKVFYWYFTVCYTLPFFFAFMTFINRMSSIWLMNCISATFLLIFIVNIRSFFILISIGVLSAVFLYTEILGYRFEVVSGAIGFLDIISTYFAVIVIGGLFSYSKEILEREKRKHSVQINKLNAELEQKVVERTFELKEALAVKTEFLNRISHEIRTPINGFSMATENLSNHWDGMNEKQRKESIDIISKSASRIKGLANHLIEASKFDKEQNILNLTNSNVKALVIEIIEECRALYLNGKKIEFRLHAAKDFYCNFDVEAIGQVVRNILINAIRFSPDYSTIDVSVKQVDSIVEVKISDQGVGIEEDELEHIFDAFVQGSRTKTGAGGVGLGLSIAKHIVLEHGGSIKAENNIAGGSSFIFTLPTVIVEGKPVFSGDILIVDDEMSILKVIELSLKAKGYSVHSVQSGEEAVDYLETHSEISLVLLDVMMPGIDGIEVLKRIRAKHKNIRVVMQSGVFGGKEIEEARRLGAEAFIRKPYSVKEVMRLL